MSSSIHLRSCRPCCTFTWCRPGAEVLAASTCAATGSSEENAASQLLVLACAAASPEKRELKHRTQLWNVVTVEGNLFGEERRYQCQDKCSDG